MKVAFHYIFNTSLVQKRDRSTQKKTEGSHKVHSNAHKVIAGFFLSPDPEVA
jgi:hypothetical protein